MSSLPAQTSTTMIDDKVNGRTYDVVLGTDWPADVRIDWPVAWVLGLQSLTQEEKEKILRNVGCQR
jgi:hypothetical protein